jgi:uncharacterized protein (DUF2147 family)
MRKLFVLVALTLTGASAEAADSYSFKIGGRTINIEVPNQCDDLSCVSIALPADDKKPGGLKGPKVTTTPPDTASPADARPVAVPTATPAVTPAAPTPNAAAVSTPDYVSKADRPAVTSNNPAPADDSSRPAVAAVGTQDQARTAPPTPNVTAATPTPVGIWTTEKNEGRVRIEPCGQNLCGYTVEANSAPGKQVLIDMKPGKSNVWNGKIHDVKNGGIYTSNISLHGPNALRVEGCAMGGMLCGGQTWARLQ